MCKRIFGLPAVVLLSLFVSPGPVTAQADATKGDFMRLYMQGLHDQRNNALNEKLEMTARLFLADREIVGLKDELQSAKDRLAANSCIAQ
ncbi:hypothetical protein [Methylobacterium sp. SyP6R]|uniref:hypothetical protein n=1 Tax=Methylobacterium sp. SyP6R TaxID=2718876 RepID=UPI001F2B5F43|nr:hypothetical protein [Methylobacterium sp. SyP6R]MCF4123845.1 hypothetical protein [Methylobacterium sp. SyP6R]